MRVKKKSKAKRVVKPPGLLGLGPVSLSILRRAGITTRAQLEKMGAVQAFIAAKRIEPKVSLNLLWGIAGAITDTHWSKLPSEYRSSLLLEYDAWCDVRRTLG
jgi:DNA transformation protein and related proteins